MRSSLIAFLSLGIAACTSEIPEVSNSAEATPTIEPKQESAKVINDLQERLARATSTCENGATSLDSDGSLALAEVDVAMAKNINNISSAEEQRIRASIGAEMGLAPSEVNGWRDIYRSRARQAQAKLDRAASENARVRREACEYLPQLRAELNKQAVQQPELDR